MSLKELLENRKVFSRRRKVARNVAEVTVYDRLFQIAETATGKATGADGRQLDGWNHAADDCMVRSE